ACNRLHRSASEISAIDCISFVHALRTCQDRFRQFELLTARGALPGMTLVKKTSTIQDVARFAEVSTATVSRALSNPGRVSEDTRARISEAVRVTGYTPNQSARSLRQRTARTILVALPDIGNPFFSVILDAIEREAAARGYGVLVANRFPGRDSGMRMREYFVSNRVDGLLLFDGTVDLEQLMVLTGDPKP